MDVRRQRHPPQPKKKPVALTVVVVKRLQQSASTAIEDANDIRFASPYHP